MHEVSILDLDKEGSLLNDMDSDLGAGLTGRPKVNVDGETSQPLLHQPSNKTDLDRGSDIENLPQPEEGAEADAQEGNDGTAEDFELDEDEDE